MRLPELFVFVDEDQARTRARGVIETLARALDAPAPRVALVVRAKARPQADVRRLCEALLPIARRARATLLVHTHASFVRELGLDGAHLSSDADVAAARALLPDGALLGASRHAGEPIAGLDYATISPVFPPTSKPDDDRATLGLDGLRAACAATPVPLFALGGVTPANARACIEAGAHGVAVLGAVMGALDPRDAIRALDAALDATLNGASGGEQRDARGVSRG